MANCASLHQTHRMQLMIACYATLQQADARSQHHAKCGSEPPHFARRAADRAQRDGGGSPTRLDSFRHEPDACAASPCDPRYPRSHALRRRTERACSCAYPSRPGVLRPATSRFDLASLHRTFTIRAGEGFVELVSAPLVAAITEAAPHVPLQFVPKPANARLVPV